MQLQFCKVGSLPKERYREEYKQAGKLDRSKLWKLAEELDIPSRELNKLAKEVIRREFGAVARLTVTENKKFRKWLEGNRVRIGERYRKMKWNQKG